MNFAPLIHARWLPLILASLLAAVTFEARAQLPTRPGTYGKTLLMDVVLPPSQLDKFAVFLQALAATSKDAANSVVFGDTADWTGDSMIASSTSPGGTLG